MTPDWSRRGVLQLAMTGCVIGLTGCQAVSQLTSDAAAPAPSCPNGFKSIEPFWVVQESGPLDGFVLSLDQETYSQGDTLTAQLRNNSDEERTTAVKGEFDIQFNGTFRWHTIFGIPEEDDFILPRVGITHQPNEGFTWQLTLSREGLSNGAIEAVGAYHACQPIKPGQYRFVYWGVGEDEEALGVPFSVTSG